MQCNSVQKIQRKTGQSFERQYFLRLLIPLDIQDWFDENDEEIQMSLIEKQHCLHKAQHDDSSSVSEKAAYNNICKVVQSRLRGILHSCLSSKADEIQTFATEST